MRFDSDDPVALENAQRLSNRAPAYAELRRKGNLPKPRSRGDLGLDNPPGKNARDPVGGGGILRLAHAHFN
jgi:hypothetical protein